MPLPFRILLLLVGSAFAARAAAQTPEGRAPFEAFAGSEEERYLRTLQLAGRTAPFPWTIRGLTDSDLAALAVDSARHPWADRLAPSTVATGVDLAVPGGSVRAIYNSDFPHGDNDGAVWAGRGGTFTAEGGVRLRSPWLSVVVAPHAFWAANAEFELGDRGLAGVSPFGDAFVGNAIDQPQRFGDAPYWRVGWGESSARLHGLGLEAGLSNAAQVWGPASEYPLVLGRNAGGFAHAFVGTDHPIRTPVGTLDARVVWGELRHSPYAPVDTLGPRRLMSGWIASYSPPGLDGLEIGATRFFHLPWPREGEWGGVVTRPFEAFLGVDLSSDRSESNQLVSVFARWLLPASGFEVYGEYSREDYSYRFRDFVLEPDHTRAFMLGAAKAWAAADGPWWVARAELLNASRSQNIRVRFAGPYYLHHVFRQGHTHRGQTLGSPAAVGGGGLRFILDRYDARGRWTLAGERQLRGESLQAEGFTAEYPEHLDVLYEISAERLVFRGPLEIGVRLGAAYDLNRYLQFDSYNANASLSVTYRPGAQSGDSPRARPLGEDP